LDVGDELGTRGRIKPIVAGYVDHGSWLVVC
jgi:hypothetical protein